jgi:replicative DNA helicase
MRQLNQPAKNNGPRPGKSGPSRRGLAAAGSIPNTTGRTMPESLEAEAAVLGSMLLDPECIGEVVQQLVTKSFYRPEHQVLFDVLVKLYEDKRNFDMVLVRDELKKRKKLKSIGGVEYLVKVAESVPAVANVEYYIRIVKEKALLRELVRAGGEILSGAYDEGGVVEEKLDEAERKIFAIAEERISGVPVQLKDILTESFERIDARKLDGSSTILTGLPTGYFELDDYLCGLQKGEMIIIAGRPSMGKTSFALNIIEHIGVDREIPAAMFSLEMNKQQLSERFLCSRGRVDMQRVRRGIIDLEELEKLRNICGELFDKPVYIDDSAMLTPLMIRAKCRRLKSQYGIQCVVIDYLQLMHLGGRVESRQQEVSTISRYLKGLAKELDIPVVVLSQLNRSPEHREGHRPRMSDLRESGSIEQDADVVMLLHREDYYKQEVNKEIGESNENGTTIREGGGIKGDSDSIAEIIIAKQRNGPTGTVKLNFDPRFTRFLNLSHVQESDFYIHEERTGVPF